MYNEKYEMHFCNQCGEQLISSTEINEGLCDSCIQELENEED